MKKLKTMLIITISATVLLTSCTERLFDFTVVSSKNVTLNFKEGGKSTKRVKGKGGSIKSALDDAIEQAGGDYDALIDGVVYLSSYYAILFYIHNYTVEGTPISTAKMRAQMGEIKFKEWCLQHNVITISSN